MSVKCKFCCNYKNQWCEEKMDSPDPDLERECFYYSQATNADRIRAMSDEEAAEYFNEHFGCPPTQSPRCPDISCYECWLNWLKQPAKEET